MVVETRPEDLLLPEMQLQAEPFPESNESLTEELILRDGKQPEGTIHTLAMMRFQEKLEQICWQQGNMRQTAPRNVWSISHERNSAMTFRLPLIARD